MIATNRFDSHLSAHQRAPLRAGRIDTLQVNVGKLCNQVCRHCHVDAGPQRTEQMSRRVAEQVVRVLREFPALETLDITGGAPELNANFRYLVQAARDLKRHVMDRCNLTVFFTPGQADLPEFLAAHDVEVIASLPCYTAENVDKQRGGGVFEQSIAALRRLNGLGYGQGGELRLNLVYNPLGPSLPPPQVQLEADYKRELARQFGISFDHLYTITNMPISRFATDLRQRGALDGYLEKLEANFNPDAVAQVMCRNLISVSWDGRLFDCDFNQMLELELREPRTIFDFDGRLGERLIRTGTHCLGCTAGAGSSCGGSLNA